MKSTCLALLLGAAVLLTPSAARANEYDRDDSDYPLRYVAYVVHPVGVLVEYTVLRPIHWLVSQPGLDKIFGHERMPEEKCEDYFKFE